MQGDIFMDIQKADINYFTWGTLESDDCEGVNHKKVLPWLSVVQAQEGSYDIALGNKDKQNTGRGGFFIAPSGIQQDITHHVDSLSGIMRARWLFIDAVLNETVRLDFYYDFPTVLPEKYNSELNFVFDMMFSTDNIIDKYACCYRILSIITSSGNPKLKSPDKTTLRIFEFIRENYMNEISISDMARYLNMSESNFYAVFRKNFGMSPIAYVNKFRISLAEEKIKRADGTIKDIALSVGIKDPVYFNKLFHRDHNMSPNEYRRKYKANK